MKPRLVFGMADDAVMESLSPSRSRPASPAWAVRLLPFVLICLAVAVVFGQALANQYAYDAVTIVQNRFGPLPWSAVSFLISPAEYSTNTGIMSYRPLAALTHLVLDARLFGLNPTLSHAVNLGMHALNGWLIYLILARWCRREFWPHPPLITAGAAGFFLLHPLVTEVVLCAGFRMDLGATLALLGGVWLLESGLAERRRGLAFLLLTGCLLAGLGFKEVAYSGVFLFPLYLLLREGSGAGKRAALLLTVLGIAAVGFFLVWWRFRYSNYPASFLGGGGRLLGIANFIVAAGEVYLRKLFWPYPLRIEYGFEPVTSLTDARALRGGGLVAAVLVPALLLAWKSRLAAFGLVWIALGFAPVSQITPVPEPIAERFCYVPMAGLSFLLAAALGLLSRAGFVDRRVLAALLLLMGVALGTLSFRRTLDWRDNIRLNIANWEQPRDERPRALEALGGLYLMRGSDAVKNRRPDLAESALAAAWSNIEKLQRRHPENPQGYRLAAIWALARQDQEAAKEYARKALRLAPTDPQVLSAARAAGVPEAPRPEPPP